MIDVHCASLTSQIHLFRRKPPTYKQVVQSNGSAKKKHKEEKPPDLWINHSENVEMKRMESTNPAPDVTNSVTIIPRYLLSLDFWQFIGR